MAVSNNISCMFICACYASYFSCAPITSGSIQTLNNQGKINCDSFFINNRHAFNHVWDSPPIPVNGYEALNVYVSSKDSIGYVVFGTYIDEKGSLRCLDHINNNNGKLVYLAEDKMRKLIFIPAILNNHPITTKADLAIKFIYK